MKYSQTDLQERRLMEMDDMRYQILDLLGKFAGDRACGDYSAQRMQQVIDEIRKVVS